MLVMNKSLYKVDKYFKNFMFDRILNLPLGWSKNE